MILAVAADKVMSRDWWRRAVIFQIYSRSFQDSNEDGIGDLTDIMQRLSVMCVHDIRGQALKLTVTPAKV